MKIVKKLSKYIKDGWASCASCLESNIDRCLLTPVKQAVRPPSVCLHCGEEVANEETLGNCSHPKIRQTP